jgi:hypothetical protein
VVEKAINREDENAPTLIPIWPSHGLPWLGNGSLWATRITTRKQINVVIDEDTTEIKFVLMAMFLNKPRRMASLPMTTKNGVPGGWGTPRVLAQAMNSPQSQKDNVGAMVLKKTTNGINRLKPPKKIVTILTTLSLLLT